MQKFLNLTKFEIKRKLVPNLIMLAVTYSFALMMIAFFDGIVGSGEQIVSYLEVLGDNVLSFFGVDIASFMTFEGFFMSEFGTFTLIIFGIFAAYQGASALAKEIEQRTIVSIVALPMRRSLIYSAKYLAGLVPILGSMIILTIATIITTFVLVEGDKPDIIFFVQLFTAYFWFVAFTYSVGFSLGMFIKSGKAIGASSGIIVVGLMLNFLNTQDSVSQLFQLFNPYYYASVESLASGTGLRYRVMWLIVFSFVAYLVGMWRFNHKDINA